MNPIDIVVKYHSRRMLLTVDLSALLETLFAAYDDRVTVAFAEMDEREQTDSSDVIDVVGGLRIVRDRFRIIETGSSASPRRRVDLEQAAVARGRK